MPEVEETTPRVKLSQSTHHEIPDGPVEDCPIIVALFTQTDEILSSFGNLKERLCIENFKFYPTFISHLPTKFNFPVFEILKRLSTANYVNSFLSLLSLK